MYPRPSDTPDFEIHTSIRYDPALITVHSNPAFKHAGWNYQHPSPLYMLPFHRDRLLRAAIYFKWHTTVKLLSGDQGLETLTKFITARLEKKSDQNSPSTSTATDAQDQSQPLKLRISIANSRPGFLALSTLPLPQLPLEALFPSSLAVPPSSSTPQSNIYTITLDTGKTLPSEYTHFKTSYRPMYDAARQRAHIDVPSAKKEVLLVNEADGSIMEGSVTTPYFFRDGRWVTPPVNDRYASAGDSGGNDGTSRRWALESGLAYEQVVSVDSITDGEECWLSNGARGFFPGKIDLDTHDRQ